MKLAHCTEHWSYEESKQAAGSPESIFKSLTLFGLVYSQQSTATTPEKRSMIVLNAKAICALENQNTVIYEAKKRQNWRLYVL